jgi:putative DNA primase/helicase
VLITLWESVYANVGTRVDVAWADLGALIAALPDGALFSCATFKGDKRAAEGFEAATAIVLDHDAASIPFGVACELVKASRGLAYETRTAGRWRIILPLETPIEGYADYTALVQPIRQSLQCARESATGAQMWFPPRNGFRYLSPFDGETKLLAWIAGDFENPLVRDNLPQKEHGGGIDRSRLDMMIAIRMQEIGVTREECDAVFQARNGLSHSVSPYHLDLLWSKARTYRGAKDTGLWGETTSQNAPALDGAPIVLIGPDIHRVADECIAALGNDPRLFTRDATIVELIAEDTSTRVLSASSVQDRISKLAKLCQVKKDKDGGQMTSRILPPKDLAEIIRDRGEYPALRQLKGITEVPILRPDGSIAEAPGYDAQTGFYRRGALPIQLEGLTAQSALETLRKPFAEFPFASPRMIDIPVALVCAVACRAAVGGNVPLFVFDASKQASGKSLLVETLAAVVSGAPSGAQRFPGDDDELAKTLAGLARASKPFISFDNVTRMVQGDALDSALTCNGRVSFRVLGQSKIQLCDWYSVIAVNGNQIRIGGDTRRRALVSRLTPQAQRSAYAVELPTYALAHRGELLSAAIALVRHGIRSGTPAVGHRPSFEAFNRAISGAIVAAGGHDITDFWKEEDVLTDSDEAREAMTLWLAMRWPSGATATQIADDLGESFMASPEATALMQKYNFDAPIKEALRFVGEAYPKASKRQAFAFALHSWRDIPGPCGLRIVGQQGRNSIWRTHS